MATTIYTYLHNDDLKGSRIIRMDDCMCMLYDIKREDSAFFKEFTADLQKPALYILINKESRKAYIGETDDLIKRIAQHLLKKDFWDEVLVFLGSNEDTISKTEVQYLEFLAYNKASDVKTFDLSENTQNPKQPHMNVMLKGKTDKFFRYVQILAQFVGCDIFSAPQPTKPAEHLFFCTQGGCNAKGVLESNGFRVLAGSALRTNVRSSAKPHFIEQRKHFIADHCTMINGIPVTKADYLFTSPSIAAAMFVGGNANGWSEWKDEQGKTLDEVYRKK